MTGSTEPTDSDCDWPSDEEEDVEEDQKLAVSVLSTSCAHGIRFSNKAPFKCYITFFSGKFTPTHLLVTVGKLNRTPSCRFFPKKFDIQTTLRYITLECPPTKNIIIPKKHSLAPNLKSRIAAPCRGSREQWQYSQSWLRVNTGKAAPI